jgi:Mce-associated membrane protein
VNPDDDDEGAETVLTLERPDSEPEPADDPAPRRRPPRRLMIALVGLLVAAAVAGVTVVSIGEYRHRHTETLRAQAVSMSHDYLVAMAAFDYQNLDANRGRIVADSSPEFATKYDEMVKALRDIVVTSKGVATATADHVAVERLDKDSATVIAFVDQHVTNVTAPQGSNQKYRMVVSLVRSGDRWIVNDVQTV